MAPFRRLMPTSLTLRLLLAMSSFTAQVQRGAVAASQTPVTYVDCGGCGQGLLSPDVVVVAMFGVYEIGYSTDVIFAKWCKFGLRIWLD